LLFASFAGYIYCCELAASVDGAEYFCHESRLIGGIQHSMMAGEGTSAVGRRMVICQEIGSKAAAGERHPDFGDADRRTRAHGKQ
jgi:hypothetical protein